MPPAIAVRRRSVELPDLLPARMLNEFVYCPRLFFYEWVEGLFAESVDTVEGAIQHRRVDAQVSKLPAPEDGAEIHARSVTLSSERLRVIAKMDLVELEGATATPVDYKHGRPRDGEDGGLELWATDRAQLGVQGIVLRENGYRCEEGVAYYRKTGRGRGVVRRRGDRGDGVTDSRRVGDGGGGTDSAAARGFAQVREVLASGNLPAGRDAS
jgi:CRISPR/Cas system-associated exonuclease Cas4 (RecB family)